MKKLLLIALLLPFISRAQDISGKWNGLLKVPGMELTLVFHISNDDGLYKTLMDSPDQNAFGMPTSATKFSDSTLVIDIKDLGARYEGRFINGIFEGTFMQANQSFPLKLTKNKLVKKALVRPQEPTKPYPYKSEDVNFPGGSSDVVLAGTLTLPKEKGPFAAVVLISGSGPQTRDEEFLSHKPFLVLSDYLTRNGIAVLRYDDRGFGKSTGNFASATSEDFAKDAKAAVKYLNTRAEIDHSNIGLIGHSEGGLVAPMVAANTDVAFIVLMAAPGVPGSQILIQQTELISKVSGLSDDAVHKEVAFVRNMFEIFHQYGDDDSFAGRLKDYLEEAISTEDMAQRGMTKEEFVQMIINQFSNPWYRYFVKYDPTKALENIKCSVLALNGSLDVQVASSNLYEIEKAVKDGGNNNITIKEYPNKNHMFQTCETGAMSEYQTIEQTIDTSVLMDISNWIKKQIER